MEMAQNNPYQTPEGDLAIESGGYGEIKFFSPKIRIGRLRYLSHCFLFTMFFYVGILPGSFFLTSGSETMGWVLIAAGYVALAPIFIAVVQRLHDLDKSGWLMLLMFIPLLNLLLGLYLVFGKGTEGANRFGMRPPPNERWNIFCAWLLVLIPVLGIVAAVALPAYQNYALGL